MNAKKRRVVEGARSRSLAILRPVLYAGRCRVELPALDRALAGRDVVAFLAHYKSAELDVSIRPAGIGGAPIGARVSMNNRIRPTATIWLG